MGKEHQAKKNVLSGLLRLEGQKAKILFILWPVIIIVFCTFIFYKTQKVIPLVNDQLTNATIVEYFQDPHVYDSDPLWGNERLFLPLNLGVFSFFLISRFAPIEAGIPVALTIVVFLYLLVSFAVFYKLSRSPALAVSLSVLSCLPVAMPASTFWGIGYSPSFLSRTMFLPFVPLFFYGFLGILKDPALKKCMLFYFLLGVVAFVHQVSSFYLVFGFVLCSFLFHPRLYKVHIVSISAWLLAVSPLIIYGILHYNFASNFVYSSALLQKSIATRFFWAFYPAIVGDTLDYIVRNPFHIIVLLFFPFIFWKNLRVKYVTVTAIAIIISSLSVYGIQFFLLEYFSMPFKFVEVLRGIRFIPFLAFMSVVVIWQDVVAYFRRTPLLQRIIPVISVVFLAFSILIFTSSYHAKPPKSSGYTCADPIFEVIQHLPSKTLIATDLGMRQQSSSQELKAFDIMGELRYCGKRPVYVLVRDGAVAYYNGTDQFIQWQQRIVFNQDFFKTLRQECLADLQRDGVTHLFVEGVLPRSDLWVAVDCSSQYCLYKVVQSK